MSEHKHYPYAPPDRCIFCQEDRIRALKANLAAARGELTAWRERRGDGVSLQDIIEERDMLKANLAAARRHDADDHDCSNLAWAHALQPPGGRESGDAGRATLVTPHGHGTPTCSTCGVALQPPAAANPPGPKPYPAPSKAELDEQTRDANPPGLHARTERPLQTEPDESGDNHDSGPAAAKLPGEPRCDRCAMEVEAAKGLRIAIPFGRHGRFCPKRYPKHPERARRSAEGGCLDPKHGHGGRCSCGYGGRMFSAETQECGT